MDLRGNVCAQAGVIDAVIGHLSGRENDEVGNKRYALLNERKSPRKWVGDILRQHRRPYCGGGWDLRRNIAGYLYSAAADP